MSDDKPWLERTLEGSTAGVPNTGWLALIAVAGAATVAEVGKTGKLPGGYAVPGIGQQRRRAAGSTAQPPKRKGGKRKTGKRKGGKRKR